MEVGGNVSFAGGLQLGMLNGKDRSLHPAAIGGNWLSIHTPNFNGLQGPNFPNPDGGVLFTNSASSGILPWGMYMGLVKDEATTSANSIKTGHRSYLTA